MDVTGYVVQFKQPAQQEWSRANEKVFERSKRERERAFNFSAYEALKFSHLISVFSLS